jgi:hypothetical protein
MPKKKSRSGAEQTAKELESLTRISFKALVVPVYRIPKYLIAPSSVKEYKYGRNLAIDIFGLLFLLAILAMIGNMNFFGQGKSFIALAYIAYGIIGIIAIAGIIRLLRYRKRTPPIEISRSLDKALRIMDSTSKWYYDENAANQELVSTLKALNIYAVYPYTLPNGRTADAKVGNVLIEGKLSPNTAEVDRLIGQLSDYTQYANKLNVVIYGKLDNQAKRRIDNEIQSRYFGKVSLTYLNNPKRLRSEQL